MHGTPSMFFEIKEVGDVGRSPLESRSMSWMMNEPLMVIDTVPA